LTKNTLIQHERTLLGAAHTVLDRQSLDDPTLGNVLEDRRKAYDTTIGLPKDGSVPQDFYTNKRKSFPVACRNDLPVSRIAPRPSHGCRPVQSKVAD
jgi:hypothetical protein